jgi:hypothetical protein
MMMIVDMQVVWMSALMNSEKELEGMDENDEWSDTESLTELEGDELEASLQALRPKLPITSPEEVTTPYDENPRQKIGQSIRKGRKKLWVQFHKV